MGLFYLDSASKSPAADQQDMQDMQAGQIEQSSNSLIVQAPVSTATILTDFQFRPNNLGAKKGGKVTFINKDAPPHCDSPEGFQVQVG